MIKHKVAAILCVAVALFVALDAGAELLPFFTQNQSPLVSIYGLPYVDSAKVAARGEGGLRLTMDLANHYVTNNNAAENIVLDGESLRLTFSGRYGIGRRMELGIDVPLLVSGGGFLDHSIENYHSMFGFPNGGRELAVQNRLLYRYRKNGVTLLNLERSGQGLGDVRLTGGWQIYAHDHFKRNVTLRGSLKLPTGDAGMFFGSGSVDTALWLAGNSDHQFSCGQLTFFGAAGAMAMSKGRILPDQQRPLVGFGALGLGFLPASWIEFKVQTNAHSSFYSGSDLKEVSAPSAQLTLGGALHFAPKTVLDIGVSEDIWVGTSPDVVFHLSLQHRF